LLGTLLTLYVIPTAYMLLAGKRKKPGEDEVEAPAAAQPAPDMH